MSLEGRASAGGLAKAPPSPARNCPLCPRLVDFRGANRAAEPHWHNAPVPTFGNPGGRLLIVGLAPGLKGANRTGRPFTGDYAGELLYQTLLAFGFARGSYKADPADGLELIDCAITNAVRCVPPQNKPTPAEITTCRQFLAGEIECRTRLAVILALGRIAHESVLAALGAKRSVYPFAHGRRHALPSGLALYDSFHCSRYNTNTGKLTTQMFEDVIRAVKLHLDAMSRAG